MTHDEVHKARVLASIKREETKRHPEIISHDR